jgi:hypothetical protein
MADTPAKPNLTPNPLAQNLVDAAGNPKPYVVLSGYFGEAPKKDGYVRLYTTLDFLSYYEIQKTDVLYAERPDLREESTPAKAYVAAAAKINLVQGSNAKTVEKSGLKGETVQSGEAAYLQGGIAAAHLADAIRTTTACLPDILASALACHPSQGLACSIHLCAPATAKTSENLLGSALICATTKGLICSVLSCPPGCPTK